jgi:2-methylisocitrate lyase-like PEP mutase family enzyme
MGVEERRHLRGMLDRGELVVAPGAYDPLTARIVESLGFSAIEVGGMVTGAHLATTEPLVTLTEQVEVAKKVADAVRIPVMTDAGAGFGEPVHVARTVELFEAAGLAGIHIEDQIYPKRVSYFRELEHMIPLDEFIVKIKYALAARRDKNFLIIGRTDAFTAQGGSKEETVRRAQALKDVGVDVLMLRGVSTKEELSFFRKAVPDIPMVVIAGAKWVDLSIEEYRDLGFQIVVFATSPVMSAVGAVYRNYEVLKNTGRLGTPGGGEAYFAERRIVEKVLDIGRYMDIEAATTEKGTEDVVDKFAELRGAKAGR